MAKFKVGDRVRAIHSLWTATLFEKEEGLCWEVHTQVDGTEVRRVRESDIKEKVS